MSTCVADDPIVGELLPGDPPTVLVRGELSSRALHSWAGGAFGELLVQDAITGNSITGVKAKGAARRRPDATVVLLRLRSFEAIFLAFGTASPRLRIVAPQPEGLVSTSPSSPEASDACVGACMRRHATRASRTHVR